MSVAGVQSVKSGHSQEEAWLSWLVRGFLHQQEIPGSIIGDFNVCFDYPTLNKLSLPFCLPEPYA